TIAGSAPLKQHGTAHADVSSYVQCYEGLKPQLLRCLEMPKTAACGPRMLMIHISTPLPQPSLKSTKIAGWNPTLRLATERLFGKRISKDLHAFVSVL